MKAFVLAALQPPATYFTLGLSGHYSSSLPAVSLVILTSLPGLLWISSRLRHRFCGTAPAYASIVGHFGSAFLTFFVKFLPVAGIDSVISFLMASCIFGVLFTRMTVGNPGRINWYHLEQAEQAVEDPSRFQNSSTILTVRQGGQEQRPGNANFSGYNNLVRGKYCELCASFIERYDHHCAAIQNCVGLKNTRTFLLLLTTSCIMETAYLKTCNSYVRSAMLLLDKGRLRGTDMSHPENTIIGFVWKKKLLELLSKEAWVLSTAMFAGIQIAWQVPYLVFQLYLIGVNLTMDEWVHWDENPRFYKPINAFSDFYEPKMFCNPYDKGFVANYMAMLNQWRYPIEGRNVQEC